MINFDRIYHLQLQLKEADNHWNNLFNTMLEAFNKKYGSLALNVSLKDLGLTQDYENYLQETKTLKAKIEFEINLSISELSKVIAPLDIDKTNLIDYRIPFRYYSHYNEILFDSYDLTSIEQVQMYLMQCENEDNLRQRIEKLKREPFFFHLNDVLVKKGKANYQKVIGAAEQNLKFIKLFDKSGKITLIGKVVKNRFDNYYRTNEDLVDERNFFSIKGITLDKLIKFFFDFINLDSTTKYGILENFCNKEDIEANLSELIQFSEELKKGEHKELLK